MRIHRATRSALVPVVALALTIAPALVNAQKNQGWQPRALNERVVNGQEEPLPKAVVYLKNTKTLAIKTYISDPDGGYHFPSLAPNVDYEIYAEYQGSHSDTKTLSGFDNRKLINVTLRIK